MFGSEDIESLRSRYKPDPVDVLFVSEAPPADHTFFYRANSDLAGYIQLAFQDEFGRVFETRGEFLHYFQAIGCYLENLSPEPVEDFSPSVRRKVRSAYVDSLAQRMAALNPLAIVVVVKGIANEVEQAMRKAGLGANVPLYVLPFPSIGNQPRFISGLANTLRELNQAGILRNP